MAVRLPGLLGPDLTETARLSPSAASLTLKMHGPGEVQLTIPEDGPAVSVHDWISIYTQKGFAGVFRVTNAAQNLRRQTDLTLLHGIDILSDSVWQDQTEYDGSVSGYLAALLNQQTHLVNGVKPWVLGICEDTGSIKKSINYDRLSNLLEALEEEGGDYYFTYDQTTWPWTLSYVLKPAAVSSEFRLSRNVRSASVTLNDADLCTRLILSVNTGEGESAKVTIRTYDNQAAQAIWGVVIKTADIDTGDTPPGTNTPGSFTEADAWAQAFLAQRAEPSVQIQIEGEELGKITGDTWDEYSVAALCRAALPDYGKTFDERVVSVTYPELLKQETRVTVSLANALPRFSENIANAQRAASAASRYARASARAVKQEITHWSQRVEHVEDALDETGIETLYASGIDLDAEQGVTIYSLVEGLQSMYSAIKVNRDSISLESQRILMVASQAGTGAEMFDPTHSYQIGDRVGYNGKMYEFTADHSGTEENPLPWDPTHVQEVASLQDQIADNAGDIYDITQSAIMQNASSITGVVGKFEIDSQGNLVVKDGGAFKVKKSGVEYGLYSEDNLTAGLVVGLINNQQTGEGVTVARISADKIILDGTTTATTLDARLANVDDLFTTQGYSQTIYTGTIYTNNVHITSTNAETGVTSSKNFSPKSIYIGNTLQDMEFLGNDAHHVSLTIPNAVTGFGTATSDATTGEITIPFYTYDNPSNNWAQGNKINFNIANMAFFKSHVGISNLSVTGGTDQGSQQDYSDSSAQVVTVVADGYYIVAADAKDGTHEYKKFHVPAAAAPVTVNVSKGSWSSGGITFSTNPASGTGAAVSLAFVIPTNTSNGNAQISVVDSASPGSSSQPLSTGLSKTLTLTCDDNYATLKDGGTTVARVPNNKPSTVVTGGPITSIELRTVQISGVNKQYAYNPSTNEYTVYVRAKGTNLTDYDSQIFVSGTEARNSVTVTGISRVASCSFDQDDEEAVQDVQLTLSNGKTVTIQDVHFDDIYADGLHGRAQTTQVEFEAELSSGGSVFKTQDELYLNVSDIYQQGVTDAGSSVTYVYAYASGNDNPVNMRKTASGSTSNLLGRLYCNTKVQLISYANGYAYVSYDGYTGYISCSGGIDHNYVWSTPKSGKTIVTSGWSQAPSGGGDDPTPGKTITKVTISSVAHNSSSAGSLTVSVCSATSSNNMPTSKTAAYVNSTTWNLPIASGGYRTTSSSVSSYLKAVVNGHYAGHAGSSHSSMLTIRVVVSVEYSDGSSSTECVETTSFPY